MQCGEMECLPICTACVLGPSPMPSPLPTTVAPTALPTAAPTAGQIRANATNMPRLVAGLASGCLVLLAIGVVAIWNCTCRRCDVGLGDDDSTRGASALPSNQQSLLWLDNDHIAKSELVELVERSVMIRSYATSPAPVFVVGRDSMRVTLWSPGMAIAAPMLRNPVGCLLSDLPFVNASDGYRLGRFLRRIFEAPAEHDAARTYMLHLQNRHRNVLLEMVATHFDVRGSEAVVVMAGRQVDSDLAVLLARETTVATSEANYNENTDEDDNDVLPINDDDGVLPINDREGGDANPSVASALSNAVLILRGDDDANSSVVSSLTMSTFKPQICGGSTVSSLTTPTMTPGPSEV